jgi:thymidine phosphorylase
MSVVTMADVIRTKREGRELSDDQINWFIRAFTDKTVADEQAASLLMAIVWRSLTPRELSTWTAAMIASGDRLDLGSIGRPTVDKHSTGGVGDKVSLPLCPLVAACGVAVPQLSGRGLGHTGGTLDKLESIPGWRCNLTNAEFLSQLQTVGAAIAAAGEELAPADKRMYALRDVTGTVESVPLIASSIMSKKIAEGTDALVLDVKVGSGAFLPSIDQARTLARTMVDLGTAHGVRTTALVTDMDQPLGRTVGNALEVRESLELLAGGGPSDLYEVTLALARAMVELAGLDVDPEEKLRDGSAMDSWRAMIQAQGGEVDAALPTATEVELFSAPATGVIQRIDARQVGDAAWRLGAGRARKEDAVLASAGIVLLKVAGDQVQAGEPIMELHLEDPRLLGAAMESLAGAVSIGESAPEPRILIHERLHATH